MQWDDSGLHVQDLVGGASGGIVSSFVMGRAGPLAICSSIIVGALTANYLGEPAAKIIGTGQGSTTFIVGLGAMVICQKIIDVIQRYNPGGSGGRDAKTPRID